MVYSGGAAQTRNREVGVGESYRDTNQVQRGRAAFLEMLSEGPTIVLECSAVASGRRLVPSTCHGIAQWHSTRGKGTKMSQEDPDVLDLPGTEEG